MMANTEPEGRQPNSECQPQRPKGRKAPSEPNQLQRQSHLADRAQRAIRQSVQGSVGL